MLPISFGKHAVLCEMLNALEESVDKVSFDTVKVNNGKRNYVLVKKHSANRENASK